MKLSLTFTLYKIFRSPSSKEQVWLKNGQEEMENRNTGDLKKLYYTVDNFENNWPFFFRLQWKKRTVIIINI